MEWLTDNKIPVGKGAEGVVNWLIANATWFFDGLENGLSVMVDAILAVLQFPPPLVGVAIITALIIAPLALASACSITHTDENLGLKTFGGEVDNCNVEITGCSGKLYFSAAANNSRRPVRRATSTASSTPFPSVNRPRYRRSSPGSGPGWRACTSTA